MSRWLIEKNGTGIEKSGTGVEKSGTGIEKSGTGIEKSGTGIEKSGTGIRRSLIALAMTTVVFAAGALASSLSPNGELSITVENGVLTASWSIDGSLFAGIGSLNGSNATLSLTELSIAKPIYNVEVVGGGTGDKTKVVGGGTGSQVVGGGTGSHVVGGGTGAQVVGGGTGSQVVGGGTGSQVVGGGTGVDVVGGGTGSRTLVVGGGTGADAIAITLPGDQSLQMAINLSCNSATVYVMDSAGYEVVSFPNVKVKGDSGLCGDSGTLLPGLSAGDDNFDDGDSRDFNRDQ